MAVSLRVLVLFLCAFTVYGRVPQTYALSTAELKNLGQDGTSPYWERGDGIVRDDKPTKDVFTRMASWAYSAYRLRPSKKTTVMLRPMNNETEGSPMCKITSFKNGSMYWAMKASNWMLTVPGSNDLMNKAASLLAQEDYSNFYAEEKVETIMGMFPRKMKYSIANITILKFPRVQMNPTKTLEEHRLRFEGSLNDLRLRITFEITDGVFDPSEKQRKQYWWYRVQDFFRAIFEFVFGKGERKNPHADFDEHAKETTLSSLSVDVTVKSSKFMSVADIYLLQSNERFAGIRSGARAMLKAMINGWNDADDYTDFAENLREVRHVDVPDVQIRFTDYKLKLAQNVPSTGFTETQLNRVLAYLRNISAEQGALFDFTQYIVSRLAKKVINYNIEEFRPYFYKGCNLKLDRRYVPSYADAAFKTAMFN